VSRCSARPGKPAVDRHRPAGRAEPSAALDFLSASFDAARALATPGLQPPVANVRLPAPGSESRQLVSLSDQQLGSWLAGWLVSRAGAVSQSTPWLRSPDRLFLSVSLSVCLPSILFASRSGAEFATARHQVRAVNGVGPLRCRRAHQTCCGAHHRCNKGLVIGCRAGTDCSARPTGPTKTHAFRYWMPGALALDNVRRCRARTKCRILPCQMGQLYPIGFSIGCQVLALDNVMHCRQLLPPELEDAYDPFKRRANIAGPSASLVTPNIKLSQSAPDLIPTTTTTPCVPECRSACLMLPQPRI
jgi:hypothetical protein